MLQQLTHHERLASQLQFLIEVDKLKKVLRKTFLMDKSRLENTAEHSWHVSLMAAVLQEHANSPAMNINLVIRMLLLHDLVEIDAGDTFAYDLQGYKDKEEREQAAARRLFGMLPEEQSLEWMAIWQEFEEGITCEAQFASALDRLQPVIHNYYTGGLSWKRNGIVRSQVMKRLEPVKLVSDTLWSFSLNIIEQAINQGLLLDDLNITEES